MYTAVLRWTYRGIQSSFLGIEGKYLPPGFARRKVLPINSSKWWPYSPIRPPQNCCILSIPNNHCVLSDLIQPKISFSYFIATFSCIFYIFYFQNLLLLHHIGMPIPYLKKSGIKNPKVITQVVGTIQHSAFGVVLDWLVQLSWIVLDFAILDFLRYGIAPIRPLNGGCILPIRPLSEKGGVLYITSLFLQKEGVLT